MNNRYLILSMALVMIFSMGILNANAEEIDANGSIPEATTAPYIPSGEENREAIKTKRDRVKNEIETRKQELTTTREEVNTKK